MKYNWLIPLLSVMAAASPARAQYLATITINGTDTDWDPAGTDNDLYTFRDTNEASIADASDVEQVYIANNATYFYFALRTYANFSGTASYRFYVDAQNDTPSGGNFDADDRYVDVTMNGATCQSVIVRRATNDQQLTNVGCGTGTNRNAAASGRFLEGRVLISTLYSPVPTPAGRLTSGILVELVPNNASTYDITPGLPLPTFIEYDNTAVVRPTFARVRRFTAEAAEGGVLVQWRTSSEYFSAGTWVVRAKADGSWQPVTSVPSATQNLETGDSYSVLDPDGHPGDSYALVEVDSRTLVTIVGPAQATVAKATSTAQANTRLVASGQPARQRRDISIQARLSARARERLAAILNDPGLVLEDPPSLDVDVVREGLYTVCDNDTERYGGVPSAVTLRGAAIRAFAVTEPCVGLGFYAPAPSSPYAPFDVYRITLAARRSLSAVAATSRATYSGALEQAILTAELTPRRYLDMRDGTPNRFFWSFASRDATAPITLPTITGAADLSVDVHPLSVADSHTIVVRTDRELGRATVGEGWSTVTLPGLDLAGAPSLTFIMDVDPSVIETVLIADARLRYRGEPVQVDGGAHFDVDGAAWVGVRHGSGHAFDVTTPSAPYELVAAPVSIGLAVQTAAATRAVFVGGFITLSPTRTVSDTVIDDAGTEAEYLVLAPHALLDTAQELAALRRASGLSASVLSYDAVYARFTGGNPDPSAIASLIDWANTRWRTPPRYLVLLGSVSSDPYGYTGVDRAADAPLYSSLDPTFTYRRFSDRELTGMNAIAVGRIPTSDAGELGRYIDKLRAYEAASPAGRWTMVAGERGGEDPDFESLVASIGAVAPSSVVVDSLSDATPEELMAAWPATDVVAYAGHGDVESWANDILSPELAPNLTTSRPPVTLSSACMDAMAASATGGLAWSLVSADVGHGSIAAIAPASIVEPIKASAFLTQVTRTIASGEALRWGDAWLLAQTRENTSAARGMVLIGDPAIAP